MKINELAIIKVGQNISRISDDGLKEHIFYTFDDLNFDLTHIDGEYLKQNRNSQSNHLTHTGDIVASFVGTKATVVTEDNQGKLLNQNFAKVIIDGSLIDPYYFCYVLNESNHIRKQKNVLMQGTNLPKMTPSILKALNVNLPNLQKQSLIGRAYFNLCKRQYLLKQQSKLEEQFFLKLIQKSDVDNN
ncbi:restriction endonuclease subunit S [Bacillus thuringiensis]|uniref:restriction endonuclease subunit S n=1 Tax=Bacillus sp. ok061 TaxID=1761766 RepID=UPI00089F005A|nr:restriction endonuclease subunit S [Bacillus sp. ok061]MED1902430.1 restriction endonuclease subunit S [Bacillus thuringiensis]SEG62385.1 Type I restriction modification DNA specificity domain-containing protein [Bacillus sp. ok061]